MIALIGTILLLIVVFFVSRHSPWLAGLIAVIPIKIIGTSLMVFENGDTQQLHKTVEGMLIGQFVIGFILLAVWFYVGELK